MRDARTVRVRRGIAVALVYLTFAAAVDRHRRRARHRRRLPDEDGRRPVQRLFHRSHGRTSQVAADRDVDRLQRWLNTHHLRSIKIEKSGHRLVKRIRERDVGRYTHRIVNFVEGAAISIGKALFDGVLIFVVSIYMLLDMHRLAARRRPALPAARRASRCSCGWSTRSRRTCAGSCC